MAATCGTCRHWKPADPGDEDPRYGTCGAIPHAEYAWDEDTDVRMVQGDWLAVAVDASGYFAALKTKESFACALHEIKPPA